MLLAIARPFPKAYAHLLRVGTQLTLRAAIRAVIRLQRAERVALRNSAFQRDLCQQTISHRALKAAWLARMAMGAQTRCSQPAHPNEHAHPVLT